ncbi:DUF5958 family protein [Streptomyces sp. A30]|uniref:DUF5958 family protein n=1 Tax=Streptomyces sp. A30 TaxID=2789273 RepID=UPI0039814C04
MPPALFRLLVCLVGVADKHRGERFCAAACTHAWHQPVRNQPGGFGLNRRRGAVDFSSQRRRSPAVARPRGRRSHAGLFGLEGDRRA